MDLKSKSKTPTQDRQFACLIMPMTLATNNEELYADVRQYGRAVIRPFKGASYDLLPAVTLTPEQFEEVWQGD